MIKKAVISSGIKPWSCVRRSAERFITFLGPHLPSGRSPLTSLRNQAKRNLRMMLRVSEFQRRWIKPCSLSGASR